MLYSINYCTCVFLKCICIYFSLYYRKPCDRKLFTGLIMYYPLRIKNIVLYCIVQKCLCSLVNDAFKYFCRIIKVNCT